MIDRALPPRHHRLAVLVAVFAIHALLIALILLHHGMATAPPAKRTTIAMIALQAERPAAAKPPPPALPSPIAKTFEPITVLSIPTDDEADTAPGASGLCAIPTAVLDALMLDPSAVEAVRRAPPETRSIAGALVLWNVGWSPATATAADPLFVVRANVERSLRSISASCLDEPIAGPRMLPIPDGTGEGTLFLVFGSGNWTWRGLILAPAATPPEASLSPSPNLAVSP